MPILTHRKNFAGEGPTLADLRKRINYIVSEHRMELKRIMMDIAEAKALALKLENDKNRFSTQVREHTAKKPKVFKICTKCPSEDFTSLLRQIQMNKRKAVFYQVRLMQSMQDVLQ